jgi:hypothetical protein
MRNGRMTLRIVRTTEMMTLHFTRTNGPVDEAIERLISAAGGIDSPEYVREMILAALKAGQEAEGDTAGLKLMNSTLKEMRFTAKVFAPYQATRKVTVFGSARVAPGEPTYEMARLFGQKLAEAGYMVITGGGAGIMQAAHEGAGPEHSFGVNIRLPFEQATNRFIRNDPKLINFKYFFTRKLMFVRSSHAIALFPGGFGTMDEGFEVLTLIQTGKSAPMPVVFIDHPGGNYWHAWQDYVQHQLLARGLISPEDLALYKVTDSVDQAVREVCHFYDNFHSVRYWRDEIAIRLRRAPDDAMLRRISHQFADIKTEGDFRVSSPLKVERDEPALANLPRLVFRFNKRDHGRLRQLIDLLNDLP